MSELGNRKKCEQEVGMQGCLAVDPCIDIGKADEDRVSNTIATHDKDVGFVR